MRPKFRKQKYLSNAHLKDMITQIKGEMKMFYERQLRKRDMECEELKQKVQRLKRYIRTIKKKYEALEKAQNDEEESQIKSDVDEFELLTDESWDTSTLEDMIGPSEVKTEMSFKFCSFSSFSPFWTRENPPEKLDKRTNFCLEAAVGILYNNPLIRDAVLHKTEADQREGDLQILYDVFSQMGRPPHLPNSELLQKLSDEDTFLDYIGVLVNTILHKVPHAPKGAFENLVGACKERAVKQLEESRTTLTESIMFTIDRPLKCKCEKETIDQVEFFVQNYEKQFLKRFFEGGFPWPNQDEKKTCDKCKATLQDSFDDTRQDSDDDSQIHTNDPDYAHFVGDIWAFEKTYDIRGDEYAFCAAAFEKKITGEFCYVIRKKKNFWLVTKKGVKIVKRDQVNDLFLNPEIALSILQLKKVSEPLDSETCCLLMTLDNPPARFENIWGVCSPIAFSNAFLSLPKKLRNRLKELEVPKGERPHPKTAAILWEFIDGSEKVVAKQKKQQWKKPAPYPRRLTLLLMKLGILKVAFANQGGHCRLVETSGTLHNIIMDALFARHSTSDAFNAFASYKVIEKGEELRKNYLEAKELNIVTVYKIKLTVEDILRMKPPGSLLIMFVCIPFDAISSHATLVVVRPQNDFINFSNNSICYYDKLPDAKMKHKVYTVFCIPNMTTDADTTALQPLYDDDLV